MSHRNRNLDELTLWLILAVLFLALIGCAAPQRIVIPPTIVKVPVIQPCLTMDQLPAAPKVSSNAELRELHRKGGSFDLVLHIQSERLAIAEWTKTAEALLRRCAQRRVTDETSLAPTMPDPSPSPPPVAGPAAGVARP